MHVSETSLPRGEKPQEHYHEGDPIRVRILRIDDGEMKIGLSGVDEGGQPLEAVPATATAQGMPEAPAETAPEAAAPVLAGETEAEPAAAEPSKPAADAGEAESAPKKRRARKKTEEPKT
jgi:hypothetical protein